MPEGVVTGELICLPLNAHTCLKYATRIRDAVLRKEH